MGDLLGNAVRSGTADDDVLVAGEGPRDHAVSTCVLPTLPVAAVLSRNHVAAMALFVEFAEALYCSPMPLKTWCRDQWASAEI